MAQAKNESDSRIITLRSTTQLTGKEIKVITERGGQFFNFLFDLLTDAQKVKVSAYLEIDQKLKEVIQKW